MFVLPFSGEVAGLNVYFNPQTFKNMQIANIICTTQCLLTTQSSK